MHDLTLSTVEVEGVVSLAGPLESVVAGRILSLSPHPTRSNLTILACDIGQNQPISIVCGARNLSADQLVPVALPGATIRPHGGETLQRVAAIELAGQPSQGVVCAANELGLQLLFPNVASDEIPTLAETGVEPGVSLAAAIGWVDHVFEIDNKSLTNRPDLWGHHGIARELAAIYGCELTLPRGPWPQHDVDPPNEHARRKMIGECADEFCHRFSIMHVANAGGCPSPLALRSRLARLGQRSINLAVDLTNYVMLDVGQPCHVYDADRVKLPIDIRRARVGETLTLLDNSTLDLTADSFVIADAVGPIGLAAIMGGADSGVSSDSNDILIEAGNFSSTLVRRTGQRLNLRTEASTRFEKALDTQRISLARARFMTLLRTFRPQAVGGAWDDVAPRPTDEPVIEIGLPYLNSRLGKTVTPAQVHALLGKAGFEFMPAVDDDTVALRTPSWRATGDVSEKCDLVEEVARFIGYDHFELIAPRVALKAPAKPGRAQLARRLREALARSAQFNEVVTYPWVEDRFVAAAGLDDVSLHLAAPPSPEQARVRTSLVPGLLRAISQNARNFERFRIFELGQVFHPYGASDAAQTGKPGERRHLAAAFVGTDAWTLFLEAKGVVEALARQVHMNPLAFDSDAQWPWLDPNARIDIRGPNGARIGGLGVLAQRGRTIADLRNAHAALFHLDVDALTLAPSRENTYSPAPALPELDIDISMQFPEATRWEAIAASVAAHSPIIRSVQFLSEYRGAGVLEDYRSLAFRVRLGAEERTLRIEEGREVADAIRAQLEAMFGGLSRSH